MKTQLRYIVGALFFVQRLVGQGVVINEVQYKNTSTLKCIDGKYYDWVELYNTSTDSVDISGYYLKDGYNDSDSLLFENCVLAPHDYLLIFCSDKVVENRQEYHAPFKLSVLKDTVFLFSQDKKIEDVVIPQCVPPNNSLARWPDGADFAVTVPSPNHKNDDSDTLVLNYQYDNLLIDKPGGFYADTVFVELQNLYPDNEVRYTLNGEEVKLDALLYNGKIMLTSLNLAKNRYANYDKDVADPGSAIPKAQVLRAQVYSCGCPASEVVSQTYYIGDHSFTHGLPVVSIITDPNYLFDQEEGIYVAPNYSERGKKSEREAHIEIFDANLNKIIDQDAGIRIHGAGSRISPQKSFRLCARASYGDATFSYPFFSQKQELTEFPELLLKCLRDWTGTLFKAEMCQYIVEDLNVDYSASETVIVLLDGEYWGVYNLRERISDKYISNNYALETSDFDLIKYTRTYRGTYDEWNKTSRDVFGGVEVENGSIDDYAELVHFLASSDPKSSTFYEEVSRRIDVSAFIDYLISELYLANVDFIDNNVFFWKPKEDGALWRPIFYDLDASMANIKLNYLSEFMTRIEEEKKKPYWSSLIFSTLLDNEEFATQFSTRYYDLLRHDFSTPVIIDHIDHFYDVYQDIIPLHIYRWNSPVDLKKWQENVDVLYQFAIERPVEVFKQMNKPQLMPYDTYPNPVRDRVNIKFYGEVETVKLTIYTTSGQVISQQEYHSVSQVSADLLLDNGVYIMHININGFMFTEKLIVNN